MQTVTEKLDFFLKSQKIPNIIFHGASGSGKRFIVNNFLLKIYRGDKTKLKSNVMMVNCAHGKGIKFVRDELKFFAKTNIQSNEDVLFKSIVLINADSLTIDAQSALRRCIEVFCHNTRFFIIVENKQKLLNPILSRFCEIYVPEPMINGVLVNFHKSDNAENAENATKDAKLARFQFLLADISTQYESRYSLPHLIFMSNQFYENGFSVKFLIDNLDKLFPELLVNKNLLILCYYKLKPDFRCEKMLFFYVFKMIFLDTNSEIQKLLQI